MAFSPLRSKALHRGRCLSLPSKLHPAVSQFNQNLDVIKASQPVFPSLSSMERRLSNLKSLYCNMYDLLVLPHIQQIISQECKEKWVDQALDGYVRILDACTAAKDLFSHTKHEAQELLSALRRKDVDGIQRYQTSRKKSKKMIQKSLKDLRSMRKIDDQPLEEDDETMALVYMLREAESAAIATLESSVLYIIGSVAKPKLSGWSLVSKLVQSKKQSNKGEGAGFNEFNEVDSSLLQMSKGNYTQLVNHLKGIDSSIQVIEEELDCLFRQLIKTRAFLLNILNL